MSHKTRGLSIFSVAAIGLVCCITSAAHAASLTIGFTGNYAVSNWIEGGSKSLTHGGRFSTDPNPERWLEGDPGSVDTSGVPDTIIIRAHSNGSDAPEIPGVNSLFTFTTTAVTKGRVSFDWEHAVSGNAPLVSFGFLNGTSHNLNTRRLRGEYTSRPGTESGSVAFLVNTGDTFGFFAKAFDGFNGVGIGTISNFSVNQVSAPPVFGLFLSAFGLLGWFGRVKLDANKVI